MHAKAAGLSSKTNSLMQLVIVFVHAFRGTERRPYMPTSQSGLHNSLLSRTLSAILPAATLLSPLYKQLVAP